MQKIKQNEFSSNNKMKQYSFDFISVVLCCTSRKAETLADVNIDACFNPSMQHTIIITFESSKKDFKCFEGEMVYNTR